MTHIMVTDIPAQMNGITITMKIHTEILGNYVNIFWGIRHAKYGSQQCPLHIRQSVEERWCIYFRHIWSVHEKCIWNTRFNCIRRRRRQGIPMHLVAFRIRGAVDGECHSYRDITTLQPLRVSARAKLFIKFSSSDQTVTSANIFTKIFFFFCVCQMPKIENKQFSAGKVAKCDCRIFPQQNSSSIFSPNIFRPTCNDGRKFTSHEFEYFAYAMRPPSASTVHVRWKNVFFFARLLWIHSR